MTIKMKEYNPYELRFLQVLITKAEHFELLCYNFALLSERIFWTGTYPNGDAPIEGGGLFDEGGAMFDAKNKD